MGYSRTRGFIKTLLDNVENAAMVRECFFQDDKSWNKVGDSHNTFMTLVEDEREDHVNAFHQYNQLTQERAVFNESIDDYIWKMLLPALTSGLGRT